LTKPYAATVILQLVQEGKVSLDDPASKYGIALSSAVLVRHLLSHTSEGTPGSTYIYNGDRYSLLDSVIVRSTGMSVAAAIQQRVISPLALPRTAPNPLSNAFNVTGLDRNAYLANLAHGYTWDRGAYSSTAYPNLFSSAAGLTSSALDEAAFSMALDRDALLTPAMKALAWTPVTLSGGGTSPYGLGWFSTQYKGVRIIWHYGYWTANSSLIIKVPDRKLTYVVLANTDGLSAPYPLGSGKLETSPWAREFLDAFVIGNAPLQ
jgi:CubicO group peptidase (beta-lactamase class C family)